MNDPTKLHPWIEPELEARLAALVLGEASDFEREELERLVAERPELALYRERLEAMHRMLREVAQGESAEEQGGWRLAPERREAVLARLGGTVPSSKGERRRSERKGPWSISPRFLAVAASILFLGLLLGLMFPASTGSLRKVRSAGNAAGLFVDSGASEGMDFPAIETATPDSSKLGVTYANDYLFRGSNASIAPATDEERRAVDMAYADRAIRPPAPVSPAPAANEPDEGNTSTLARRFAEGEDGRRLLRSRGEAGQAEDAGGGASLELRSSSVALTPPRAPAPAEQLLRQRAFPDEAAEAGEGAAPSDRAIGLGIDFKSAVTDAPTAAPAPQSIPTAPSSDPFANPAAPRPAASGGALAAQPLRKRGAGDLAFEGGAEARGDVETNERVFGTGGAAGGKDVTFGFIEPATGGDVDSLKRSESEGFGFENRPDEGNANSLLAGSADTSTTTPSDGLVTSVYQVPPTFLAATVNGSPVDDPFADPFASPSANSASGPGARPTAKRILESAGISFPEGTSAIYNAETSQLIVRNTKDQSELVEAYIEGIAASIEIPKAKTDTPAALGETSPEAEPFSTFSLHVSDVSFQLAKAALASGQWPEAEKIRIEEFVNAFDYGDPVPSMGERVAARIDQAAHPFLQQRQLVRIALRTAEAGRSAATPLRLTLLLDTSGSMERPDRRETVRRAVTTLTGLLGEHDRVTLVSFARQPRLVADAVPGHEAAKLAETVAALPSEGGTNLEAALQLAFEKAREHREANAQNRIVLLTDGAANLGDAKPESLGQRVEMMRDAGIAFDAAGIGAEGLNDEILEALTRKGDGRYYLLDRPEDAEEGFAKQIAGAFRPAAKNVKVQVEFDPGRVKSYKLLGFEKHRLATEDFRNDAVDAAELAAAEAGVAVYQVEPDPAGSGDLGSISVRFRDLESDEMVERRWTLPHLASAPAPEQGSEAIRLATVASQFAAKLAGGPLGDVVDLGELARLAAGLPESARVRELREMIEQARGLEGLSVSF
jgi:Mg-chelatase subunit ChlD